MTTQTFAVVFRVLLFMALATYDVGATPVVAIPAPDSPGTFYLNELIVEIDPSVLGSADDIVATVRTPALDSAGLTARLGKPIGGRVLTGSRLSVERLSAMTPKDPLYQLRNTVVLTFPDDDATLRAQMFLAREPGIKSQSRNCLLYTSGSACRWRCCTAAPARRSGRATGVRRVAERLARWRQ